VCFQKSILGSTLRSLNYLINLQKLAFIQRVICKMHGVIKKTFLLLCLLINSIPASRLMLKSKCVSAMDCGLNGECVNDTCVCDKGWRGTSSIFCLIHSLYNVIYLNLILAHLIYTLTI